MRIILLGPPGCGKGTQGDLIEKKYGFPKISSGDLLRAAVQKGTPLGKKAEAMMNRGELVSDDIVIEMIKERISKADCQSGYVLDGFPRNITQAQKLEDIEGKCQEMVFDIQLKTQSLIERLSARRICPRCEAIYNLAIHSPKKEGICDVCGGELIRRKDDTLEVIRERLRVYNEQTEPLVDYYQKKEVFHEIDGAREIEAVFRGIQSILDKEIGKFRETEVRR
ncbi:MAG: adenylate kinase [Candidatus Aminicenantes bacterium]|nr:MAG: adenylate kinase [Candidatus Aminicenantes bacterium]